MVLPTRALLIGFVLVAIAGAGYFFTQPQPTPRATTVSKPAPVATTSAAPTPTTVTARPKPVVKRAEVPVEVYNNSGIKGLAGATSGRASSAGWNVVGSDNWYGTISTTTVYYPARLKAAAKLLAKDLGIASVKPAVDPMRFDRLTVILTADYR